MSTSRPITSLLQCGRRSPRCCFQRCYYTSPHLRAAVEAVRPSIAPKISLDIKHVRSNPELYAKNCVGRNYAAAAAAPYKIIELFEQWHGYQQEARTLRERNNRLKLQLANPKAQREDSEEVREIKALSKPEIIDEARVLKEMISAIEVKEEALKIEIDELAASLPNLTSDETPRGNVPTVLNYINDHPEPEMTSSDRIWRSHVHIGTELDLLDFTGAAITSGWGWYYLLNEAAQLEQALVQYAQSVAMKRGWVLTSPPSMVYRHIADACGFQPRDQHGEQQIYKVQQKASDVDVRPEHCLTGTAEISLAGMKANQTLDEEDMPMKRIAASRCYRAEAGGRGIDTKGLYRVHEFTKLEMFAWTLPETSASTAIFDEMLSIQTEIFTSLGLHCRILEMPSTDLGASATRKRDIEAFFPSRRPKDDGWGEITSASTCSDYQSRRLATKISMRSLGGKTIFPYTVNGTAMAVPRVLAAILENGWDEKRAEVRIPKVLQPWMGGMKVIKRKFKKDVDGGGDDQRPGQVAMLGAIAVGGLFF